MILLLSTFNSAFKIFVSMKYWNWFIEPILNFHMSFLMMFAFVLFLDILNFKSSNVANLVQSDVDELTEISATATLFVMLGIGYFIRQLTF